MKEKYFDVQAWVDDTDVEIRLSTSYSHLTVSQCCAFCQQPTSLQMNVRLLSITRPDKQPVAEPMRAAAERLMQTVFLHEVCCCGQPACQQKVVKKVAKHALNTGTVIL